MLEITLITQVGVKIAHYLNNSPGCTVSFISVFNSLYVIDHFLYISSILRQCHPFPLRVIIVNHNKCLIDNKSKNY